MTVDELIKFLEGCSPHKPVMLITHGSDRAPWTMAFCNSLTENSHSVNLSEQVDPYPWWSE